MSINSEENNENITPSQIITSQTDSNEDITPSQTVASSKAATETNVETSQESDEDVLTQEFTSRIDYNMNKSSNYTTSDRIIPIIFDIADVNNGINKIMNMLKIGCTKATSLKNAINHMENELDKNQTWNAFRDIILLKLKISIDFIKQNWLKFHFGGYTVAELFGVDYPFSDDSDDSDDEIDDNKQEYDNSDDSEASNYSFTQQPSQSDEIYEQVHGI